MGDVVQALRSYQQADQDGVMVRVSRQACEEGAAMIEDLHRRAYYFESEEARLRHALEIIAGRKQCVDNLMSNVDVARAALDATRDDV